MLALLSPYQKVQKTFVFQNQQTSQSIILDLDIDFCSQFINLNHIFNRYCPLRANRVNIYEPRSNSFVTLRKIGSDSGIFHKNLLEPSVILIRYSTKDLPAQEPLPSSYDIDSQEKKDMRSRERTVGEAIDLVKKWRNLHLNCTKPNNNKKKINLQEAAKMLGVSKKSLDDYYCQLRLAELYQFDFGQHLNEKMGVLRSFVKERKVEEEQKNLKPHRHPKNLKIIEDLEIEAKIASQLNHRGRQKSEQEISVKQQKPKAADPVNQPANEPTITKELSQINFLEYQFYRGFEFRLDDPTDPFLTLNKDFSKKLLDDESDGILFY